MLAAIIYKLTELKRGNKNFLRRRNGLLCIYRGNAERKLFKFKFSGVIGILLFEEYQFFKINKLRLVLVLNFRRIVLLNTTFSRI